MSGKEYGIVLMLTLLTAGMIIVRVKARVEANWLPMYWALMLFASVKIDDTWDYRMILGGLAAALMLRFEFISHGFETLFRTVEMIFFAYVFYRSYLLLVEY
jgi:hypothetical protein